MGWQKNPFTMLGTIRRCWLFTFQTPIAAAKKLLPAGLAPVTHGEFAFWNVVISQLAEMRPKPFPAFWGVGYWHAAYRIYVKLVTVENEPIEGLYFLRSDCDSSLMALAGNLLTNFNFHTAPIKMREENGRCELKIDSPDARARAVLQRNSPATLPPHSAFGSVAEASAFLKYKPRGISLEAAGIANVVEITRAEADWRARAVTVEQAVWQYFTNLDVRPELCFEVEPISYQWNRARICRVKGVE